MSKRTTERIEDIIRNLADQCSSLATKDESVRRDITRVEESLKDLSRNVEAQLRNHEGDFNGSLKRCHGKIEAVEKDLSRDIEALDKQYGATFGSQLKELKAELHTLDRTLVARIEREVSSLELEVKDLRTHTDAEVKTLNRAHSDLQKVTENDRLVVLTLGRLVKFVGPTVLAGLIWVGQQYLGDVRADVLKFRDTQEQKWKDNDRSNKEHYDSIVRHENAIAAIQRALRDGTKLDIPDDTNGIGPGRNDSRKR